MSYVSGKHLLHHHPPPTPQTGVVEWLLSVYWTKEELEDKGIAVVLIKVVWRKPYAPSEKSDMI